MNLLQKSALILPAIFMISVNALHAQTDVNYDPKAKTILDDVSKTAKAYTSITATFTVTTKHADGTSDVRNGNVVMSGGKYKIVLENTVKTVVYKDEYYNDGKTTWVFVEKTGELTIDDAPLPGAAKGDAISPNDLFTLHEKGFKYKFIKTDTVGGKVYQHIDLYPEKPDKKNYSIVHLTIDKSKKQITKVEMVNKDGSTTTYSITTFTANLAVTDATFQFDATKHTVKSTVDMRED
ncbi:MAG TPA: outer membrane lipoprotein carrier protein LolA [Bacteroidia bacterium]|jgi:outer membrane lipoprotein-sorting protein|nr:outer membrane lipoprotein carrier protein LolA [Bacteroidia bacterium]